MFNFSKIHWILTLVVLSQSSWATQESDQEKLESSTSAVEILSIEKNKNASVSENSDEPVVLALTESVDSDKGEAEEVNSETQNIDTALDAEEILSLSDKARGADINGLAMESRVTSYKKGKKSMEYLMAIESADNNSLITFVEPARSKGIRMLINERNMWFASPDVRKPVPISPRQRLLGDANNGDIATSNYSRDYDAALLGEEEVLGEPCYVLELTAKDKKVTYDKIKYFVSKNTYLGMKSEFYSVSGKKLKTAYMAYENTVNVDGNEIAYISKMEITNSLKKHEKTVLSYSEIEIKDIEKRKFSINSL